MTSDEYLNEIYRRLRTLFSANKAGYKASPAERHRLEGFMQAGVFLGLSTNGELTQLMESVHLEVFGTSMAERNNRKSAIWREDHSDYSEFETPAFERHSRRTRVPLQTTESEAVSGFF